MTLRTLLFVFVPAAIVMTVGILAFVIGVGKWLWHVL